MSPPSSNGELVASGSEFPVALGGFRGIAHFCREQPKDIRAPNPAIERTSTGWPRYAVSSFFASRGQPVAAAHGER